MITSIFFTIIQCERLHFHCWPQYWEYFATVQDFFPIFTQLQDFFAFSTLHYVKHVYPQLHFISQKTTKVETSLLPLLYIELTISFLIAQKCTEHFRKSCQGH